MFSVRLRGQLVSHVVRGIGLALALALMAVAPAPAAPAADPPSDPVDPPAKVQEILDQDHSVQWLGEPVTSEITSPPVVGEEDGRWVSYQVFKGYPGTEYPGTFTVTDIETGELVRSITMDTVESATSMVAATDGKVYLATYTDRHLHVYDPQTRTIRDIGEFNPQDPAAGQNFGMTAGPNGSVYAGAYPNANVYHYDPTTDQITNLGRASDTESYVHGMAYDPETDALYVGVGGKLASIWRWADGGRGEKTRITDETNVPGLENEVFISKISWVNDRLFVRTKNNALLVMQADGTVDHWSPERAVTGYHFFSVPDDPNLVLYTGFGRVMLYDITEATSTDTGIEIGVFLGDLAWVDVPGDDPDWPGLSIYGADADGVVRLNLETGAKESHRVSFPQPTKVQKLFRGPDGTMWASGYMVGLAQLNTTPGGERYPTLNQGQFESAMLRDGQMYLGSYGNGRFHSFDVDEPLKTAPVLFDGLAEKQDRPFALAYNPDRDEAYLATVPMYGQHQGALAVYDFATGSHEHHTTDIVTDQSIISVLYNPDDGLVYIGTTLDGGLGSGDSGQTEARLIVWDPATGTTVADLVPVAGKEGVTGLTVGPDGKVWGIAENVLFTLDPTTHAVDRTTSVPFRAYGAGTTYWAWAYLYVSAIDGNVYGTAGGRVIRIDSETLESTLLVDGAGSFGMTDDRGDLYFVGLATHVFVYRVPQPITGADRTQKCLAATAAAEDRAVDTDGLDRGQRSAIDHIVERVRQGKELADAYC